MGQLESISVEHVGRNTIGGTYNPLFTRKYDPFGPNVVSLLHYDDVVGTTIPTDTVPGVIWTNADPLYNLVSGAQSIFAGGNSLFHFGQGVSAAGPGLKTSFTGLLGKIFTVDLRFRFSLLGTNALYGQGDTVNRFCTLETSDANNRITINVNGVTGALLVEGLGTILSTSATIVANTWYALVIVYDGINYLVFLDGVLVLSQAIASAITGAVDWTPVNCPWGNGAYGKLFVDEARLTWGAARYSVVAPPSVETAPFIYP